MYIRKTGKTDRASILELYKSARAFMRANGNLSQWSENYPGESSLKADMGKHSSYVLCSDTGKVIASFYFAAEPEPSYKVIKGKWLNDESYGVIHRLAVADCGKGAGSFCIEYCLSRIPNIRIDTHKDNFPMLALLKKNAFSYCGIVFLNDGSERLAFQKKTDFKTTIL